MAEDNRGLVIKRGAELEEILKNKFGAQGNGLGQRLTDVEDRLAPELTQKLRFIVGIRNKAAHEPDFQLYDPEKFKRTCDEAKEMLDTMRVWARFPSGVDISRTRVPAPAPSKTDTSKLNKKNPANKTFLSSISWLLYAGIIMALAVQFTRANSWSIPFFKSYEDAFATSFFVSALGVAHTAYIWQNAYVSFGLVLTTIGGFTWQYKWMLPVVKTYEIPLYVGIFLILYGIVPQFLGTISAIIGSSFLAVELWLMFTKGLTAVHYGNLLASVILIGLSVLMLRRYKRLRETGAFRKSKT